jgi:adenosylcobinamide kinase / adenosylcobinamide-phosphate guanylyltransferase
MFVRDAHSCIFCNSMSSVVLITGGARSGKSGYAIARAAEHRGLRRFFVATAQALDDEMTARIAHHRAKRPRDFETIEEPLNVVAALAGLEGRADVVVIDCLTLWVSNLMGIYTTDAAVLAEADSLARVVSEASFASVIVTDEVGAGIVPDNPVARRFRDLLGWTNQKVAKAASEVILMVAGLPLRVK